MTNDEKNLIISNETNGNLKLSKSQVNHVKEVVSKKMYIELSRRLSEINH